MDSSLSRVPFLPYVYLSTPVLWQRARRRCSIIGQIDAERAPEPIQDGDILVIEHPDSIGEDGVRNIHHLAQHAFPGVKVIVLEEGATAKLLRPIAADAVAREWDAHLRDAEHRFLHGTGDSHLRPVGFLNSKDCV